MLAEQLSSATVETDEQPLVKPYPDEASNVSCIAKREMGKLKAYFPGASVPSGLLGNPGRFLFQNEKLGVSCSPTGAEKAVEANSEKIGGGK